MLKLFPLITITSLFFIIFFNIKFLTSTNDQNLSKNSILEEDFDNETNNNSTTKNLIKENNRQGENNSDLVIKQNEESEEINNSSDLQKEDLKLKLSDKTNDLEKKDKDNFIIKEKEVSQINSKRKQTTTLNKDKNVENKLAQSTENFVKIQFGAFSNMKNAEKQKNSIFKTLSSMKNGIPKKLEISKENNLYKILYYSETIKSAKSICDFARSKKLGCLILKK